VCLTNKTTQVSDTCSILIYSVLGYASNNVTCTVWFAVEIRCCDVNTNSNKYTIAESMNCKRAMFCRTNFMTLQTVSMLTCLSTLCHILILFAKYYITLVYGTYHLYIFWKIYTYFNVFNFLWHTYPQTLKTIFRHQTDNVKNWDVNTLNMASKPSATWHNEQANWQRNDDERAE